MLTLYRYLLVVFIAHFVICVKNMKKIFLTSRLRQLVIPRASNLAKLAETLPHVIPPKFTLIIEHSFVPNKLYLFVYFVQK